MGSQLCCERADHPALRAPLLKEGNWAVAGTLRGGRRECVGEELGLSGIRFGPEQSAPMEKPGDTDKNNSHTVSGAPEPPPLRRGQGEVQNGTPE